MQGFDTAWRSHPDPLYGRIDVPPAVQRLLGTPAVRRLARLRQLADLSLSLPAATHTRLVHSLGAMHLCGVIFDRLYQRMLVHRAQWTHAGLPELDPAMRNAVQIAGLLHDIGHGPFSHVFETIARRRASGAHEPHEARTSRLIQDVQREGSSVGQELTRTAAPFASPREIASLVRGLPPSPGLRELSFLGQIVASDLDADRMDFLVRDALQTGIHAGRADPWPIIDSFVLSRDEDGTVRLALPARAEGAAVGLLEARARAYTALYRSPESLAAHELLLLAFDERFPSEVDRAELEVLAGETDEGLLIRLEQRVGGNQAVVRDVVNRLRNDDPYLVLPIKLGAALLPLSTEARRVLARWRRPVDSADVVARREAISRVSEICFGPRGDVGPWRTLLVLEETQESDLSRTPVPWIVDRPDRPARPLELSSSPRARGQRCVSVAIPSQALIPSDVERELRGAPSWGEALDIARAAVRTARIVALYGSWLNELDPATSTPEGVQAVEEQTAVWMAARTWAAV